jgi:hypothetical protein
VMKAANVSFKEPIVTILTESSCRIVEVVNMLYTNSIQISQNKT